MLTDELNKFCKSIRKLHPDCIVNILGHKRKIRIWIAVLTNDALKPENLFNGSLGLPCRFPIYLTWKSTCWKIQKGYGFDADKRIFHTIADKSHTPFSVMQTNQLHVYLKDIINGDKA